MDEKLKVGDLIRLKDGTDRLVEFRGSSFPGVLLRDQESGGEFMRTGPFQYERVRVGDLS